MKKTTVRFAAVGAVLLLGVFALLLAQHDARQRPRETAPSTAAADTEPKAIPMDGEPNWRSSPRLSRAETTVRANNDASGPGGPPSLEYQPTDLANVNADSSMPAMPLNASLSAALEAHDAGDLPNAPSAASSSIRPSSNPLRSTPNSLAALSNSDRTSDQQASDLQAGDQHTNKRLAGDDPIQPLGQLDEDSFVQQAAGQSGSAAPATGSLPPAPQPLMAMPLPQTSIAAPPRTLPTSSAPPAAIMPAPGLLPAVPTSGSSSPPGGSTVNAMPTGPGLPSLGPPPPGWVNAGAITNNPPGRPTSSSLSDTQRSAMPATNMTPPASGNGGSQPWMQAAPMAQSGQLPSTGTGSSAPKMPSRPSGQLVSQEATPPNATLGSPQPLPSSGGLSSGGLSSGGLSAGAPATMSAGDGLPTAGPPSMALPPRMNDARTLGTGSAAAFDGTTRSPLAGTAFGNLVSNQPGNRHLDGSQNPVMQIQKRMPEECTVGKRATVSITVRNAGNSTAKDVMVIDSVPNGASFAESMPAINPTPDGILVWKLGEMGPGDERTITLQIVPERQGELGSTAEVRFAAQASMRTLATSPKLEMVHVAKPEVLIGSQHSIEVTVKNIGSGMARGVRLEADLPANLRHESGDVSLEAAFGDIPPGESKQIRLDSLATEAGNSKCTLRALTEDGVQQEQSLDLQIQAPALQAAITGPTRRYLDRPATFEVMIKNSGTAPATRCEFILRLPAGLNFNTANKSGGYDPSQHAVRWYVDEFPAGHAESVELTVLPVEIGQQLMTFQGTADLGITTEARGGLTVEEQGELTFTIDQDADPIEVSASTTYSVEVRNVGRADRNVELVVQLPPGSQVLKVDAPVASRVDGDQLRFEPIPQMDSRSAHKFRIEVRHAKVGTQIVRAQLNSQNRPTVVIKEEATEVYNDQ